MGSACARRADWRDAVGAAARRGRQLRAAKQQAAVLLRRQRRAQARCAGGQAQRCSGQADRDGRTHGACRPGASPLTDILPSAFGCRNDGSRRCVCLPVPSVGFRTPRRHLLWLWRSATTLYALLLVAVPLHAKARVATEPARAAIEFRGREHGAVAATSGGLITRGGQM